MQSDTAQLLELDAGIRSQQAAAPRSASPGAVKFRELPAARSDEEIRREEDARKEQKRRGEIALHFRRLVAARGARYADCLLSNFVIGEGEGLKARQVGRLRDYCEHIALRASEGTGVLLHGACGTGKDHLAMAVARAFIVATAKGVAWTSGALLFEKLRDSFDGKQSEAAAVGPFLNAPLLWISDPLPVKGELTPYQSEALYRLIDGRYNHRRPIIVTANLSGKADDIMGAAIARRLRESTLQIHCNWPRYGKEA